MIVSILQNVFAKYSDVGLDKMSFPVCCVLHRATGLPTGMSHRAACGWSQVALTPALWPCTLCSDPSYLSSSTAIGGAVIRAVSVTELAIM